MAPTAMSLSITLHAKWEVQEWKNQTWRVAERLFQALKVAQVHIFQSAHGVFLASKAVRGMATTFIKSHTNQVIID